jgi:hypothetical protein
VDFEAEAASLVRSLSARLADVPGLVERADARGLSIVHSGVELGRVLLRPGAYPKFVLAGGEPVEMRGLGDAAAAADRVRELALARKARIAQLDLFGKR